MKLFLHVSGATHSVVNLCQKYENRGIDLSYYLESDSE